MRIIITGAGVAGLSTALFLARDGHKVILLERDATPLPESADAAFTWDRRGAAQVRHPHAFLARLRNLLRDELPDVLRDLIDAGAIEVSWTDIMPDTLDDRTPQPGDEDLALLACRRTTFEWVLRRAALRTERVELRDGVKVTGFLTAPGADGVPVVTGVRTADGAIEADLVVDAGGRHSLLRQHLADVGVTLPEERHDTDMIYTSRFYRLREGAVEPDKQAFNGGTLGYIAFGVFRSDHRTFSLTLAVGTDDDEMRGLLTPERFEQAASMLPAAQRWADPAISEPIAGVHVMADLVNRVRRLAADGRPLVRGLYAVGDSLVCTNPLYGRGCSLGAVQGSMLAQTLRELPGGGDAALLQYQDGVEREIVPWYVASVAQDEASRAARAGGPDSAEGAALSIITDGLIPLTRIDSQVARAFFRTMNLLTPPNAALNDAELRGKVLAHWATRASRPPEPPAGPPREAFVEAMQGAAASA